MPNSSRARSGSGESSANTPKLSERSPKQKGSATKKVIADAVDTTGDVLASVQQADVALANISVDPSAMHSKDLKELQGSVNVLESKVSEFRDKVSILSDFFKNAKAFQGDEIVDYLTTKQQMLLAYCVNLLFYLGLRVDGHSVEDHPVMQQLLRLRLALEKMRAIDGKIKHQVERLLQSASGGAAGGTESSSTASAFEQPVLNAGASNLRPNPLALLAEDSGNDDDAAGGGSSSSEASSEESEVDTRSKRNKTKKSVKGQRDNGGGDDLPSSAGEGKGIYRPPRMEAVPFMDSDRKAEKDAERLQRKRQKLRSSEIFESLREEFSTAPEASGSNGISDVSGEGRKLQSEAAERRNYEEDRFVRLTMSRKDKKDISRRQRDAERLDNFADFGGMQDFDELIDLYGKASGTSSAKPSKRNEESAATPASLVRGKKFDGSGEQKIQSSRDRAEGKHVRQLGSAVNTSAAIERAAAAFGKFSSSDSGVSPKKKSSQKSKRDRD